jgi:hypothetical protein
VGFVRKWSVLITASVQIRERRLYNRCIDDVHCDLLRLSFLHMI